MEAGPVPSTADALPDNMPVLIGFDMPTPIRAWEKNTDGFGFAKASRFYSLEDFERCFDVIEGSTYYAFETVTEADCGLKHKSIEHLLNILFLNQALLKALRRYAIVLICVMSAVITPPDVMSMVLLVLPLYGLYELSIVLVGIFGSRPDEV